MRGIVIFRRVAGRNFSVFRELDRWAQLHLPAGVSLPLCHYPRAQTAFLLLARTLDFRSAIYLFFMIADDSTSNQKQFAARYAQMADGELLELALQPWALSEIAWEALEDELDSRHLELPEPEAPPQIVSLEKRNLILLRSFRDVPEALLAKGRLDSAGIEGLLADDNMVRMLPGLQHDRSDRGAFVERGNRDEDLRLLSRALQVLTCLFSILNNGQGLPPLGARRSFRGV